LVIRPNVYQRDAVLYERMMKKLSDWKFSKVNNYLIRFR
jgi:hypothetical protein